MLAKEKLPSTQDIRVYLSHEGWTEHPPGPAGSLWTKDATTLAVPAVDDPMLTDSLVMRLAQLNNRPQADLSFDVKYYSTDVTDFRAANDQLDLESIPLESAIAIIDNVRMLLRSSGTTAFRTQGDLKGHYSTIGDSVTRSAHMAHTRQGSFIIPVLVRLHPEAAKPNHNGQLIDITPPEPPERRVTRTLAQALSAVDQAIVQPASEPSMDDLHKAVQMGVSRELCVALHNVLKEPVVGELDTDFRWAPAVRPSKSAPQRVSIPAESRNLLELAAAKLKNVRVEQSRVMSGAIVGLRHSPHDSYGYITISTARNGRPAEVTIKLPYPRYREALTWHADRRVLLVEGEVEGGRGQRLRLDEPLRCQPIDDLFSPTVPVPPRATVPPQRALPHESSPQESNDDALEDS